MIRVHEAGHAVGRILLASANGWGEEEAVFEIKIHSTPQFLGIYADGRVAVEDLAVTYGPALSKPMEDFLRVKFHDLNDIPRDHIRRLSMKCGRLA